MKHDDVAQSPRQTPAAANGYDPLRTPAAATDYGPRAKTPLFKGVIIAAACLCLAVGATLLFRGASEEPSSVLHWSPEWEAADYFSDCDAETRYAFVSQTLYAPEDLYAEERVFSDQRELLESDGVIPAVSSHPLFDCRVHYNEDGSFSDVIISWNRRGEMADYSDLMVVAGHQEVERIGGCTSAITDEKGNAIEPRTTVTERDGWQIIAKIGANREKVLTFQNDSGWYQISGSFNDSYEPIVELLDWFWEHPLDFGRFPMEAGDSYQLATLADHPDAFSQYLPDFASYGFIETQVLLDLKNGEPISFDGHYVAHVDEETAKAGTYYDVEGHTTMYWSFDTEPDFYESQQCIGDFSELTEEMVAEELSKEGSVAFMWDGGCVTVYPDDASEAWALIESLKNR